MEVKNFAVSIQWGKGMHYFSQTDHETEEGAIQIAEKIAKNIDKNHKKGARPTIHVWKLVKHFPPNKEGSGSPF